MQLSLKKVFLLLDNKLNGSNARIMHILSR